MAKNKLKIEFANEIGEFDINVGTTFNDEFSEKLDSASVIISKIDRKLNIKPNDEVRIWNENGSNMLNGYPNAYYLVDTIYCKEITLNDTKQYQYTIELKSLTGYLDLIQLPNRTINHSLVSGQRNIIDYIEQFMFLYVPKVKYKVGNTWQYKPLIEINAYELADRFAVPCRDLSFSQPTLRQALTSLMLQVGCLPKVIKIGGTNVLSYLDFRSTPYTFKDIDNSQNYTSYSYASDSYVNTLVNMNDNVLDDENVVITETIGFRDTSNVLLQQTKNLFLNTTYPIYKVEKLSIKMPIQFDVNFGILNPFPNDVGVDNNNNNIEFTTGGGDDYFFTNFTNIVFGSDTQVYIYDQIRDDSTSVSTNWSSVFVEKRSLDNYNISLNNKIIVNNVEQAANRLYVLVGTISFVYEATGVVYTNEKIIITSEGALFSEGGFGKYYTLQDVDITPLCVEQSKRQLLDTNFKNMENAATIEDLAKYIYGTIGYNIGDTKIEGFSSTYSFAVGWWQETKTYIENIMDIVKNALPNVIDLQKINKKLLGNLPDENLLSVSNIEHFVVAGAQFTRYIFELVYKPLNTFRLNNVKEQEVLYPIEQLDTNENAITNFNDIVEVEQQKVNRLGNEVVIKNQRTTYMSAINNVHSKFDDYIVFNRAVSVGIEDFKVNYTASKNYVLQNYFTAIQTKYRAYEYISYGASIVRKENTTIFGRIGRDYYDGDDYIYFGNKADANNKHLEYLFLSGAVNQYDEQYRYKCAGNGDNFGIALYKTDLSILISENIVAFNTQAFDSVSYGVALVDKLIIDDESYLVNDLGGVPQKWYPKGEGEYESLTLAILQGDGIFLEDIVAHYSVDFTSVYIKGYDLPYMETPTLDNAMYLVDNNKSDDLAAMGRTYYLDQQEKLNQTIQFTFYTEDDGIKWTEKLWKLCNFTSEQAKGKRYIYVADSDEEFGINKERYTTFEDISKLIELNDKITFENGALLVKWQDIGSNVSWMKVVYFEDDCYYDLLAIKNVNNVSSEYIYLTLNDTKTDKVAYNKNGLISFNEYVAVKNTLNREVIKV